MNNPYLIYLLATLGGFILVLILTPLVKFVAKKLNIVDQPDASVRKIHASPMPLLGGLAIFIAVFAIIFLFRYFHLANFDRVPDSFLFAAFIGSLIIMIGGFLDDKFGLKPQQQIIFPILAATIVVLFGVRISFLSNPFGGSNNTIIYLLPNIGVFITFWWLLGMMYTTKFLDGLDGLATGISAIAGLIIFFLSLNWDVNMSATGIWALIFFGSCLGFLIFNFYPARIFLGEGGSVFLGFMLGLLSIISGSKIATTLLVVGIPALDVLWVVIQRLMRHESPFSHADNKHLHFRLLSLGLSQRQAVLWLYLIALVFGAIAILTHGLGKIIGLIILLIFMAGLIFLISFKTKQHAAKTNS